MTCIIGLKHKGAVYMGADSVSASSNWLKAPRTDPKIYRRQDMLLGFTSSYRMGQLLGYMLRIPTHKEGQDVMDFMVTSFVEAVRTCLKDGGYSKVDNNNESGGTFLCGYRGRLFTVYEDFQVAESSEEYSACGSGTEIALGSLYSTQGRDPTPRIRIALEAAEKFSAGVGAPFQFEVL